MKTNEKAFADPTLPASFKHAIRDWQNAVIVNLGLLGMMAYRNWLEHHHSSSVRQKSIMASFREVSST
ncbi:unnamed protein product [Gongylonema pulchrum]|uniref:Transposase n=1 Tax=Gongylonema pulchrum TaxID=637853 RepID=A0A183DXE6_9BILA|nr:unnamed protein product [Gongylonema pulchrum]